MPNYRKCLDCRQKFIMKGLDDELCPKCAAGEDNAQPRNVDPTKARPGELGHFNFRHGSRSIAIVHRGVRS